jgi:hypothetical protein
MREKGFPRRKRVMSVSVRVVSSWISRFAASSGLISVESIEPEHAAHLPLHVIRQYLFISARLGKGEAVLSGGSTSHLGNGSSLPVS